MDKLKKLLQYTPLLIPIIWVLLVAKIVLGATVEYQADYLGTISQVNISDKDLKIIILDTRQLTCEPFGEFIKKFNPAVKDYAVADIKISTGEVLRMFFYDDLSQARERAIKSAEENQKVLKFKKHGAGLKISEWFGKTEVQ